MRRIVMTRGDKFLMAGLLLISLFSLALLYCRFYSFSGSTKAVNAVISVKGTVVRKISLPVENHVTFTVQGRVGPSVVEVDGWRLRMQEAPCPGRVCVNQGWIEHAGESIICIPGEIVIRIEGTAPVDAVTR